MGTQGFVVSVGVAIALTIGAAAGVSDVGARGVATIAIAMVPVIWMLLHMKERVIGREIWQYTAPYPYRSMEVPTTTPSTRPLGVRRSPATLLLAVGTPSRDTQCRPG